MMDVTLYFHLREKTEKQVHQSLFVYILLLQCILNDFFYRTFDHLLLYLLSISLISFSHIISKE